MNTQRKLIAAMSLCAAVSIPNIASAISVSSQGTWETTLQGRDLDGNLATTEAYYDTALNITWLADANLAATNTFGLPNISQNVSFDTTGIKPDGSMSRSAANNWIANMNAAGGTGYLGFSGWRLPKMSPLHGSSFDYSNSYIGSSDMGFNISAPGTIYEGSTASELSHFFYVTMGNAGFCDLATATVEYCNLVQNTQVNIGPFVNFAGYSSDYIYGTDASPGDRSWFFQFIGMQSTIRIDNPDEHAWAVHDGDVGIAIPSAVPIPAAAWLFGSGLLGLIGIARKRKH